MAKYALSLAETADSGEYVQLEFRTEELPFNQDAGILNTIRAQLNGAGSDAWIVARAPSTIVHGSSTLGVGYGGTEAILRMTALASNRTYGELLAPLQSFGGILFDNVKLIDVNYVDGTNDTQFTNGNAPPWLKTGDSPSPLQAALGADPLNVTKGITDKATDAVKETASLIQLAEYALIIGAVAWLVMEWKR
jgi:hypothetical protein